ncbi:hypothetical protein CUJ88_35915 [Paraburkholderia hospita]|jgi:hypothetical protein|nr:hypothetical protein CUJ88_35915 [Paraburkholderia hospita]EUC16931.1 hypothetical protein PMI06_000427 [Burkholderia sp. BT03]OUL89498.1 hypothetical protein CA603_18475 [Paraburkholderia hospita]SKD01145.1 hypothetical protein SAMN05445504_8301 [Burkholderia sp. CF099]SKD03642.1 hypothetical protein SAMN06266956_8309 [Paraburkholderia hospita]
MGWTTAMSTFSALTEWVKDMWPLPLVLAATVRFVIAWLFSRRAALDRKQLDLEIARLRDDADRAERGRVHLKREIEKLMADFERQQRADSVAVQHIDVADRDRLSSGIGTAVSGCHFRSDWFRPPPPSQ